MSDQVPQVITEEEIKALLKDLQAESEALKASA